MCLSLDAFVDVRVVMLIIQHSENLDFGIMFNIISACKLLDSFCVYLFVCLFL